MAGAEISARKFPSAPSGPQNTREQAMTTIETMKLRDGREVTCATYMNHTQANAACARLGPGWIVTGHRPYYVTRDDHLSCVSIDREPLGVSSDEEIEVLRKQLEDALGCHVVIDGGETEMTGDQAIISGQIQPYPAWLREIVDATMDRWWA